MNRKITARAARGGQAMIEFLVGLVAVLVLIAGLLQVAELTMKHTDAMVEARLDAGETALSGLFPLSNPDYIESWNEGPDQIRYTTDDASSRGGSSEFTDSIANRAAADDAGWAIINAAGGNIPVLHEHPDPVSFFGLVKAESEDTVSLIPAIRELVYRAETIRIRSEVWMTGTGDLY